MRASIALLISGLAAQQVAAHWDRQASNYNTPGYNNNKCTDKQNGGYNWSDLKDGDKPGKYDDFNFGGSWSCSTKKFGKRDHLTKRTFGAKAITNRCGKEKPASFSCDQKDGFSVTHIDVSVDHDADLDFHYKMKDGSICKHRASCKKEGTTVQNTQCGGAQSVDVYLGHSSEGRKDCEIGFHQIGFDCNPPDTYTPPPPYTPAPPPSTSEVPPPSSSEAPPSSSEVPPPPPETTPPPPQTSESPPPPPEQSTSASIRTPICGYEGCGSSGYSNSTAPPSPPSSEVSPPPPSSTPSDKCGGYGQPDCEAPSVPAKSTPAASTPAESTPAESTPAESTPAESTPASSIVKSTATPPPAEVTPPPYNNGTTESVPASSAPAPSSPPSVTPPPGGYTPPQCLPKCLNTWLKLKTKCKDNTDSACYCKVQDLTDNVIDCVKAYGTDEEVKEALSYFVGICAPQIPENPHIIDKCSDVPLAPPKPAPTPAPSAPVSSATQGYGEGPKTTPAPETPGTTPPPTPEQPSIPATTITYGGSSYTVPQVGFTTETPGAPGANPTEPIALYPAAPTPAPAPANPTAPYPVPSGFTSIPLPTGTGGTRPSAPGQFTGAASSLNSKAKGVGMVAGAVLAFFAL